MFTSFGVDTIDNCAWQESAACKGVDPSLFFPNQGGNISVRVKKLCASCPVKQKCLDWILDLEKEGPVPGIYGGVSQHGRRELRRCKWADCKNVVGANKSHDYYCSDEHKQLAKKNNGKRYRAKNGKPDEFYDYHLKGRFVGNG